MESHFLPISAPFSVFTREWTPSDTKNMKGVILMLHGMAEHGERYQWLAESFNSHGYAFVIADHPGHGKTANTSNPLGHINGYEGWLEMCAITQKLLEFIGSKYPEKEIILYGHSMGSLVARLFLNLYPNTLTKIIFSGSPHQDKPTLLASLALVNVLLWFNKSTCIHKGFNKIFSTTISGKFKKDPPFSWLSKDTELVNRYVNDPYCGFDCSLGFFKGLLKANLKIISLENKATQMSQKHFFTLSGIHDPVTQYGASLAQVQKRYEKAGAASLEVWKVENARHEVHNELDKKEELVHKITQWLEKLKK